MNKDHNDIERALHGVDESEARRLREVWDMAGDLEPEAPMASFDRKAISRVKRNLQAMMQDETGRRPASVTPLPRSAHNGLGSYTNRRPRPRVVAMTAALVAASLVFVLGIWWFLRPAVITSAPGEVTTVELPDGSRAELNSDSRLAYHRGLSSERPRSVRLEGEAFFDVVAGPPFMVSTYNAEIRVVGTSFNVRARRNEAGAGTVVALESGQVILSPIDQPHRARLLSPGETGRVLRSGQSAVLDSASATVLDATAWRRGDFVFRDQTIDVILQEIRRRYDIELSMRKDVADDRLWNIVLRQPDSPESVIRDLAGIAGVRYRPISGGFELFRDSSPPAR